MSQNEQNVILNRLFGLGTKVSHRNYGPLTQEMLDLLLIDPHLVSLALQNAVLTSKIRDQQDAAIIVLLQHKEPAFREAGRCLLLGPVYKNVIPHGVPGLPAWRILRIIDYIGSPYVSYLNGAEIGRSHNSNGARKFAESEQKRRSYRNDNNEGLISVERDANHTTAPRFMKNLVIDWFSHLEASQKRVEYVVKRNSKMLKKIMKRYHLCGTKGNRRFPLLAGALFDGLKFDHDAAFEQIVSLASGDMTKLDFEKALNLIKKNKIDYQMLSGAIDTQSPLNMILLIASMTPNQARNSIAWVERSGMLNMPEVREAFEKKLSKAKSIATLENRESAKTQDAGLIAAKEKAAQREIETGKKITWPVLMLLDKSGSMQLAIETAINFGAMIGPRIENVEENLKLIAFDGLARPLTVRDHTLKGWKSALRLVQASGATNFEVGVQSGLSGGFNPAMTILISDGGAWRGNNSVATDKLIQAGCESIVFIRCTGRTDPDQLSDVFDKKGVNYARFDINTRNTDWNVLDQVEAFVCGEKPMSRLDKILETELVHRRIFMNFS